MKGQKFIFDAFERISCDLVADATRLEHLKYLEKVENERFGLAVGGSNARTKSTMQSTLLLTLLFFCVFQLSRS